jgi:alginate O-acetyltransferase complex protein AlgJ
MADVTPIEEIPTREAIAKKEIGVTTISTKLAFVLSGFFLLTITMVPLAQFAFEAATGRQQQSAFGLFPVVPQAWAALQEQAPTGLLNGVFSANGVMLRGIGSFEDELEETFFGAQKFLPVMQALYLRWLGLGNEKVYPGIDGWLFYRPDVDYVTGPGFLLPRVLTARMRSGDSTVGEAVKPNPLPAILAFHRELAARGIRLIVMPTPLKPSIEPEMLSARYQGFNGPALRNASFAGWAESLRAEGVEIFDPAEALINYRIKNSRSAYLQTDTHWTPSAMEHVAEALARQLQTADTPEAAWSRARTEIEGVGDIAKMLKLPEWANLFPPQKVTTERVLDYEGQPVAFNSSSDVLLLGDSFSNIFSLDALGWGSGAGLGEQLGYELGRPVDAILRNDAGSYATREILVREMARGTDRLAGKRVVVWQFAERELSQGDWKILPLPQVTSAPTESPLESAFLDLPPGSNPVKVTGRVVAVSPVPRPGTVPYRDHVMTVHLTDLQGEGIAAESQAVVYLFGMQDNVLTSAASWRAGDQVELSLRAWDDVSADNERFNRSELDSPELQLETPTWGELSK